MSELKNVIKGLACCIYTNCKRCPYRNIVGMSCKTALMDDALNWLKIYQEEKEKNK